VTLSCAVSTCRLPLFNAMFCEVHADKQRAYGVSTVTPLRPDHDQGCVIGGCRRRARRGLCVEHRRLLSAGDPAIMAEVLVACRGYATGQRCACGDTGMVWRWDGMGRKEDVRRWVSVCARCARTAGR
jgi:hypothetical protein